MAKSDEADVAAGSTAALKAEEKLTKRQRRKQVNNTHKWPEMPKIQSADVRAKAYIRVAGLAEPKKMDFDLNDPSVRFGRLLGSADQRIRHQAVLQLESYLKQKCEIRDDDPDEEDESNLSGISEMDLLKLWKALWHTLYMADKVPVQQELSQKLANLIWCVAGTEEEDEYAAQVYLDMYGDSDVGFDDDNDDQEDDDDDDGQEDDDDDDITMEEIENTLRQEFDYDEDEESEEEDEEEEEEIDEEEEDHNEEDEDIEEDEDAIVDSEIPHCRGAHLASLFVRTFFRTVRREWGKMDKYRVDKFYSLIRMIMHQVYRYMSLRHWSTGIMRIFNDVLHEEILCQTPNGLRYHLIDLTLDELARVNAKAPMPLTEATFLDCLEPYFAMASVDIGDDTVKARVMENIISKFLEDYSFVSENPAKDEKGKPLIMDQVHVGTVAEYIFKLASDTDTPDEDRESLYNMHKNYMRAIKKAGKDVDIEGGNNGSDDEPMACIDCDENHPKSEECHDSDDGEDKSKENQKKKKKKKKKSNKDGKKSAVESAEMERLYDGDVDTPERPRKRKFDTNDGVEEAQEEASAIKSKKKNKKKKSSDEGKISNEESEAESNLSGNGKPRKEDKESEFEDTSERKKKKKKKKAKSEDKSSIDENSSEKTNEITISVAEQKAALSAMKKSVVSEEKTKSKKSSKKQEKMSLDGKKVKFGDKNMARSWKASMKGLRTMSAIPPLPRPDKGILQNKDVDPKSQKAKKLRARKKAVDYF